MRAANEFYHTTAWKNCRKNFAAAKRGLCEQCLKQGLYTPGVIVHHKIHLTEENWHDPSVSLSYDNLMLLCIECHNKIHAADPSLCYTIDRNGNLVEK